MIIIGAGGFAQEVLDLCASCGISVDCLVVEMGYGGGQLDEYPIVEYSDCWREYNGDAICAIGNPATRRRLVNLFPLAKFPNVIHSSSGVSGRSNLGVGVIVCAGSQITTHVSIRDHVHVNLNCTIGHGVTIGEYSTLSPGVHISGNVNIGKNSFWGTGAVVLPKINIGDNTVIGAGAVVMRDVLDGSTVIGNPARVLTGE